MVGNEIDDIEGPARIRLPISSLRGPVPSTRRTRHPRLFVTLLLALAGVATLPAAVAGAAPALTWSAPAAFDLGHVAGGVSCSSETLCAAVDHEGNALVTSDPMAPAPSWSSIHISASAINAVSCSPEGLCVAVDGAGSAFARTAGSSSWLGSAIDAPHALTGVSCPAAGLCVAVDSAGRVLTSTLPGSGAWVASTVDAEHPALKGVSCASPTLCAAIDGSGDVLTTSNPTGGASAWQLVKVSSEELTGVSCSAAGPCVAVDAAGEVFASGNPPGGLDLHRDRRRKAQRRLLCTSGLCVAVDGRGEALASDEPALSPPAWVAGRPAGEGLAGVSCLAGGGCLAVSAGGRSLSARVPAPLAVTLPPNQVTPFAAAASATVNPRDAVLSGCSFEFGTSSAYGQSAPCTSLPSATAGNQSVGAQLEGLAANTTYHYRIIASSPSGTTQGADVAFTTALSSSIPILQPHPSITGTPAIGQRLTCHPTPRPRGSRDS